ncbi:hypothetical protein E5288_WYG005950 [Bos mutus]|uniref:Uncharacterized protein n=1 Tax=Bos mutus TaxID=72004 RepID=A0A6B0QV68_9CETA|nr:hypothetical protein [Bos mutus]
MDALQAAWAAAAEESPSGRHLLTKQVFRDRGDPDGPLLENTQMLIDSDAWRMNKGWAPENTLGPPGQKEQGESEPGGATRAQVADAAAWTRLQGSKDGEEELNSSKSRGYSGSRLRCLGVDLLHQLSHLPDTEALEAIHPLFTVQPLASSKASLHSRKRSPCPSKSPGPSSPQGSSDSGDNEKSPTQGNALGPSSGFASPSKNPWGLMDLGEKERAQQDIEDTIRLTRMDHPVLRIPLHMRLFRVSEQTLFKQFRVDQNPIKCRPCDTFTANWFDWFLLYLQGSLHQARPPSPPSSFDLAPHLHRDRIIPDNAPSSLATSRPERSPSVLPSPFLAAASAWI